jgi:hypothetical protein
MQKLACECIVAQAGIPSGNAPLYRLAIASASQPFTDYVY